MGGTGVSGRSLASSALVSPRARGLAAAQRLPNYLLKMNPEETLP